ncbi:MAG: Glu-tRNA(Gln) amidotransferase subunit GatE [Nitrososphaerota archaeon]|nr:Glu-tRNA(Gln) amidotransferase subunit GatE [Nitrososphaerota archaeon]MDG6979441.1 Glu-tRNA(Gln) amidotransferase subunit GatE [Nitrososphaerota archaeon]MDG7022529.1 Glu-tRNA(Gln) amidotransferase subunit GatE [Nitrososphaerota archaeon]
MERASLPFDPEACQFRVGLEVHQQLAAGRKLFCPCPITKSDELPLAFERRLRPTQSELGQIDPAAVFEFNKGRVNLYRWNPESACLVEADEEPPHPPSTEAVETAMLMADVLGSRVVDEVHFMRKLVIDGSNTSGFQRTAIVGLGGSLRVGGAKVGVLTVTVEEDSARVLKEGAQAREYALDRLGVPLVEIALDHVAGVPEHVEAVALSLGRALRSTGRVARGQGTIRQDLNVSLLGGQVVEVKGVQKLGLVAKVVRYEATRQMGLVKIAEEVKKRGVEEVESRAADATDVLRGTASPVLRRIIQGGGVVTCVAFPRFAGLLGLEPFPGVRLGKELAEIARTNGLGGVIHSDEFAKQGLTEDEGVALRALAGSDSGAALVLVAGDASRVVTVAALVAERVKRAPLGVVGETRAATDEGETRYLRPRPGAARMYPETDIPEIVVTDAMKARVGGLLPVRWEEKVASYSREYSLSEEAALQLYDSGDSGLFEELVSRLRLEPSVVAAMLVEIPVRLSREGVDESRITPEALGATLAAVDSGRFAKEAAVDVLRAIGRGEARDVDEAVERLGLKGMGDEELEEAIAGVVSRNRELIAEKGDRAFSVLMGEVMKVARGKVDGKKVSSLLREAMKE